MKRFLRLIFIICLVLCIGSVVLLLNFTAPNPTGRRYSSEVPRNTGDTNDIGDDAERILANDLRVPNNNDIGQRQCLCSNNAIYVPSTNQCTVCVAHANLIANFRVPDFVSAAYLADSKNWQRRPLAYTDDRLREQISDFTAAAQSMRLPFWLYVPVTAFVDPRLELLIKTTSGGGIVYYFTVPGYVDPVDRIARMALIVSAAGMVGIVVGSWAVNRVRMPKPVILKPSSPRPPKKPSDPTSQAIRKTEAAEDFLQKQRDRERQKLDVEDSRDEF